MVESGGNTRLAILNELYLETGDEAFNTVHCLFVPWKSEAAVLSAHLIENEMRGDMTLIVRRYLAQFYPPFEYDQTLFTIQVNNDVFSTTGRQVIYPGWKQVLSNANEKARQEISLPMLKKDDRLTVTDSQVEAKQTQPPARFTEGTLIQAMKNIGRMVDNPVLKKHLVSTEHARSLIDALPEPVKDPGTTAVWEQALEEIAQGQGDAERFVSDQANMAAKLTEMVKQNASTTFRQAQGSRQTTKAYSCPKCQHPLLRRKGRHGFFWGCRNYPDCTVILPDDKGKPGKQREKAQETGQRCPEVSKA